MKLAVSASDCERCVSGHSGGEKVAPETNVTVYVAEGHRHCDDEETGHQQGIAECRSAFEGRPVRITANARHDAIAGDDHPSACSETGARQQQ